MTPERLELNEFGPYTDPQTVDFEELGTRQLFLIHGATGSGKSTLLDAICFALYGETSGSERDGDQMRSDFATPEDPTEVTLDFCLGADRYRVRRRPQQTLAKKRGEGTTTKSEQATLYDRSDAGGRAEDGEPIADGKRAVDHKVEGLLGLAHEQFRQVVVLPQGKFRKFLSAGSSEREDILKVLFETERYERLEEVLNEMAAEAEGEVQCLRQKKQNELSRQEAEDVEALEEKLSETKSDLEAAKTEKDWCTEQLKAAREELEQAKSDRETLNELEAARSAVEDLREERAAHETRKKLLDDAQRAAEVAPVKEDLDTRLDEKEQADRAAAEASAALEDAEDTLADAEEALAEEQQRDPKREALREKKTRLQDLEGDIEELEELEETLTEVREKKEALVEKQAEVEEKKAELEDTLEEKRKELEEKEVIAENEELREKEFEEAKTLNEKAAELDTKESAVEEAEEALREAKKEREAREEALRDATETLETLEAQRRDAFASVLAEELTEGDPCPVCGSEEHPAPAHEERDVPSEDEIDEARTEKKEAREALDNATSEVSAATSTHAEKQAALESLKENHPALIEKTREEIESDFEEAEVALAEAQSAAEEVEGLTADIQEHEEELAEFEDELDKLDDDINELQRDLDGLDSKAETIRERLPDDVTSADALNEAIDETTTELEALEQAQEGAQAAVQEAREERLEKKQSVLSKQRAAQQAAERLGTARARFDEALRENDFGGEAAFEEAYRDKSDRESLKEEVQDFDERWAAATDRKARAEEEAEDVEEPDVEEAKETVASLEEELDEVKETVTTLGVEVEEIQEALQTIEDVEGDLQEADERYSEVGFLAELARGDNESRMSLQRFVLATRLEDVLHVANEHLEHMAQNRYQLLRSEHVGDRRSGSGLDLLVYDAHTGKKRPVATLSGGEGFMAALALALGLSDVVQSLSGGRHLETIFIDEGFGSLDPEALDRAMEALSDLRDTGRLVGIISHVSELKQRVAARLEVEQTQEGSSLSMTA